MSKDAKLASGDKALLRAAQTGEGAIEVTPDLLRELRESMDARRQDIAERFPAIVAECPYETRLAVTAWVIEQIVAHAKEGGTFRYLIYDRLGFDADAYMPLYCAGGMTISNEFDLSENEPEQSTQKEAVMVDEIEGTTEEQPAASDQADGATEEQKPEGDPPAAEEPATE